MRLLVGLVSLALVVFSATESLGQEFSLRSDPEIRVYEGGGLRAWMPTVGVREHVRYTVVGDDAISFVDGSATHRHRIDGKVVGMSESPSGRFAALLVLSDGAGERPPGMLLEVLDTDAGPLYRISLQYNTDEPFPSTSIGDDGSVAVVYHATGEIAFLSPSGEEVAEHGLTDGGYDIERSILISRAGKSGVVAVAVNEPVTDGTRSVTAEEINLFTSSGQRVGTFDIPPLTLSALAISSDGARFAVGGYDVPAGIFRTSFYDDVGREQYHTDFAAEAIQFDASGVRVMISDKRRLAIVQLDAARTIVQYGRPSPSHRILATAFSEDGRFALALSGTTNYDERRFVHDKLELAELVMGPQGNYVSAVRSIAESAESVDVDIEASGMALSLDDKLMIFRRSQ